MTSLRYPHCFSALVLYFNNGKVAVLAVLDLSSGVEFLLSCFVIRIYNVIASTKAAMLLINGPPCRMCLQSI